MIASYVLAVVTLVAAAPAPVSAPALAASLQQLAAAAVTGARTSDALDVELLALVVAHDARATGCTVDGVTALAPVATSGEVPVRLDGRSRASRACSVVGMARVRVTGPALRLTTATKRGAAVTAVVATRQEALAGGGDILAALPNEARAARPLARGAILRTNDIEHGPRLGEAVRVVVRSGVLELMEPGRIAACPGGATETRACATLRGGRRVSGVLDDHGALVVAVRR